MINVLSTGRFLSIIILVGERLFDPTVCLSQSCGGRAETHSEAVIDVLGAGLGHAGIGQVDLVKDDRLQGHTLSVSRTTSPSLHRRSTSGAAVRHSP